MIDFRMLIPYLPALLMYMHECPFKIAYLRDGSKAQSFFLSYQGDDISTSLIELYDGKTLTEEGLIYFYIHGANCYDDVTRIIHIKELKVKIVFPDIKTIMGPNTISSKNSSYLLH